MSGPIDRPRRRPRTALALCLATLALAVTAPATSAAATTKRVSVRSNEAQADGNSLGPAISADGRFVAFDSGATDLVKNDTNGFRDVFVRDRTLGTTKRVSVGAGGQADGESVAPAISADGRLVAFLSSATDLVPNDTNGDNDIFVRGPLR